MHIADEIGAIRFAREDAATKGPLNAIRPQAGDDRRLRSGAGTGGAPPRQAPRPDFALKALLGGEMTLEMLLGGQRVAPAKLLAAGYQFRHPDLDEALADALSDD